MTDENGDGTYENYYEGDEEGVEDCTDGPCVTTDAEGDFTAPEMEDGEYMFSMEDPSDTYGDVDYVVEVVNDSEVDEDTGEYTADIDLAEEVGSFGVTNSTGASDGTFRIVLTWMDDSDYDAYWSFPRYDFHNLMDDSTSPFYPDHMTLNRFVDDWNGLGDTTPMTVPTFCDGCASPTQGWDSSAKFDQSVTTTDLEFGGNPFRFISDTTTTQYGENVTAAVAGEGDNFNITDTTVVFDGTTGGEAPRGLMYWDFWGTGVFASADAPLAYTIDIPGEGTVTTVGMDNDSYVGSQGAETIFINHIPNNNWFDRTDGMSLDGGSDEIAMAYDAGDDFGDEFDVPAWEVGMGQYTVVFYSNVSDETDGADNVAPQSDSTFATSKAAVNIYSKTGARLWTFVVPDGNADEGQTLPFRNWRPFTAVYQAEENNGDTSNVDEAIKIQPVGFDKKWFFRNGFGGFKTNIGSRAR
jgi:hypothetical protein